MAIEYDFRDLKAQLDGMKNPSVKSHQNSKYYDYPEAYEIVTEELLKQNSTKFDVEGAPDSTAHLNNLISRYQTIIRDILSTLQIKVNNLSQEEAVLTLAQECVGYDIISDLMEDEAVTDIFIYSYDLIYYEKHGKNEKFPKHFRNKDHLEKFISRLATTSGKQLDKGKNKILDFELYGCRYCATSETASPLSPSLTIRKHPKNHITYNSLLEKEVLNEKMGALLSLIIKGERSGIVAGITGSGKTTTLRALLDEIIPSLGKRALVCEDTQELFLQNEQTLSLVSETTDPAEKKENGKLTLADLIVAALRLKPKYAIIGEARDGFTCLNAVEAMQTGHSTWLTAHSDTPENMMNRFATKYLTAFQSLTMEVVERILGDAVDYIICQDDIPGIGRKVSFITEVSYDYANRKIDFKPIYEFDITTKSFVCKNDISQAKANLMMRRGVLPEEITAWRESEGFINV